jgi:hypothetical protein
LPADSIQSNATIQFLHYVLLSSFCAYIYIYYIYIFKPTL